MGSLAKTGFLNVPRFLDDEEVHRRLLADAVNLALQGKLNNTTDARLRKDAVSTSVSDVRCGPNSVILPMPTSADGGTALGTWSVKNRTSGSFVITHGSTSTSDATLTYAIFG